MPDIPTLTSQAEELARTHSFWNSWSVIFVAVTALAAVLYFIGQWMTNKRGNDLNTTQASLIRAKDEQLARDLKEKDGQIADANKRAGLANEAASKADESAAKANERAQKLESDNLQLRTDLETATAEARAQQAELAREQGKLEDEQRKTAEAQRAAAEAQLALKKYLDEVAARQADRKLSKGFRRVREIAVDELDRGNNWPVAVQYKAGDDEAFRFAQDITNALRIAGWHCNSDEARPIARDESIDGTMRSWFPSVRPGITIIIPVRANAFRHKMVSVLDEDLTAAGFRPTVASASDGGGVSTIVTIIVGSKISY